MFEQILCASVVPVLLAVRPGIGALYMTLFTALATSNWATTALGLRW